MDNKNMLSDEELEKVNGGSVEDLNSTLHGENEECIDWEQVIEGD